MSNFLNAKRLVEGVSACVMHSSSTTFLSGVVTLRTDFDITLSLQQALERQ